MCLWLYYWEKRLGLVWRWRARQEFVRIIIIWPSRLSARFTINNYSNKHDIKLQRISTDRRRHSVTSSRTVRHLTSHVITHSINRHVGCDRKDYILYTARSIKTPLTVLQHYKRETLPYARSAICLPVRGRVDGNLVCTWVSVFSSLHPDSDLFYQPI